MKAVQITGERKCDIVEKPEPKAVDEFVVVKIHVAPMCTEYRAYKAGKMFHPLGHESAGEVVDVAQKGTVEVGQRVVVMPQYPCGTCSLCLSGNYIHCQNNKNMKEVLGSEWGTDTYAQFVVKQDWLLLPIPKGMSYEHAGMACCGFGPTFGASELMNVGAFDTVLITGLGPVGLGGVMNARYRGARVIGVESNPYRARLAKELGAETVLDPNADNVLNQVLELTDGQGVDKAIECSGTGEGAVFCIKAARRKGQVSIVGGSSDFTVNGVGDFISKGLSVRGAWHWNLGAASRMMKVIKGSGEQIDKAITHSFPLDKVREAWELQLTGQCGKVLLKPWE
jgi:L-iditol 2-dehydrogenase